jgi:hypothetical protein
MTPLRTLATVAFLGLAGGALAAAGGGAARAVAGPAKPAYVEYAALGDSWSADVVIANADGPPDATYAPIDCAQSHKNYPKLVAAKLGISHFKDATCGSATTDDFSAPQTGLPAGGTNPPQFDRLTGRTTLVTVGIGGNDAGIASAGLDCLNLLPITSPISSDRFPPIPGTPITPEQVPLGGCKAKFTEGGVDQLSAAIQAARPKLVAAFRQIHKISPKARILALDYLAAVPDHGCYPTVPATDEDMAYIHDKFLELNAMVRSAAKAGGAEFVNTYTPTLGHDMCQLPTVRYAETYGPSVNDPAVGVPAHPNAAGARAQARVVLDYLEAHPR